MDTTKDYANGVMGEHIRYFRRNGINTNDRTNPLLKLPRLKQWGS
jgi:hypothetical protein